MATSARRKAPVPPPEDRSPSLARPLAVVFAVALALRIVHIVQMRHSELFTILMGDSRGYHDWARRLAAGDWIGSDVFYQAPLYPYFLGVIYRLVGPDPFSARVAQAVVGALACVAITYAGARLFSRRAGVVAGVVPACYPAAVFFDGLIQKSVLDLFFTCTALALIAALIAGTPRPRGTWMALGVTIAALSLTRENALLFAVVIMAWAATRRAWQGLTVFVAGMMLLFLPVVARNALVGGGFYLTTSQLGSNFFIGNNSEADGTYMSLRRGRGSPEFEMLDAKELAEQAVGRALTPAEVSSYWLMRSFDYIQTDPTGWLKLMGRKAALLVNASEMIDTESLESHAEHSLVLRVLRPVGHFGVLLPLALIGTVVAWPQRRGLWIVYVLAVTYAMGVVAFFVMARYRHPLLAFLALFGGLAVAQARELIQAGSRRQLATAAALALAAVLVANQSMLSETLMRAITEHNLGTALQEEKRFDEAITHYQRAIALEPTYGPAFNNLGTALMGKGDIASAVAAFRESYRLQPSSGSARELLADATYDAGVLLLERNDYRAAENALRESLMLEPDSPEALNNLGIALASQGRIDEAVLQWQRALAIKPDLQNARENLERARELQQSKR